LNLDSSGKKYFRIGNFDLLVHLEGIHDNTDIISMEQYGFED
jgi:hypothetical protein